MTLRRFEIINPSDKVVISAPDDMIAIVATLVLGGGGYGLRREDDVTILPIFLGASGGAVEEWLADQGVPNLGDYVNANHEAIARCLDSCFYGSMSQAKALDIALEGLPDADERLKKHNEARRSSMNNIGKAATELAKRLREEGKIRAKEARRHREESAETDRG